MRFSFLFPLFFFVLIPCCVQAFSVELVDISIGATGDATIQMNYKTDHIEVGAYALANVVMDVKSVAKERLENVFEKTVAVEEISPETTRFRVYDFAYIINDTITTPDFQFMQAEDLFNKNLQWVKDALSLDFTPKITNMNFIDGHTETFENADSIPKIVHLLK